MNHFYEFCSIELEKRSKFLKNSDSANSYLIRFTFMVEINEEIVRILVDFSLFLIIKKAVDRCA